MPATTYVSREVTVRLGRPGSPRTSALQEALRRAAWLARTGHLEVPFAR